MNRQLTLKIISRLFAFSLASAEALAGSPVETKTLTTTKAQVSPEQKAIDSTIAKLAIQLALQRKYVVVNGKTLSVTRPDGTVGTYLYDRDGRVQGISFSDGRAITAIYDENGNIQSILENGTGQKIIFKKKAAISNTKDKEIAAAFALEKGISVLIDRQHSGDADPICVEKSPIPCVVEAPGGGGGGGGWSGGGPRRIPSGGGSGGGGGGGKGPIGPAKSWEEWSKDPEKCIRDLCVPTAMQIDYLCTVTRANKPSLEKCRIDATLFYKRCAESCYSGDFRWLDTWGREDP
ncbi:RHS repeat domain-containing protein [Massilia pseudoviolaceinigra]|uniref:RHS repeat domain-containing protein n=1 Tax=Massilia pseudoviolaceinigra TaxID=3057165 RepID=UPI002796619B|nr:RHS repeat domain-containing protein [Massilia sp. CCM 9206]MDQ1924451.1 RHS repeat domain-containing protein [Massilia sp. CCM 9206]